MNTDNLNNLSELDQMIHDPTSLATSEETRKCKNDSSAMQTCNYKGKNKSESFILQYLLLLNI